ncbi:MAG: YitT family protein [Deltaproteobacteria bacterium]|nr:YitT family protein [Deltaproteobacteria bacterium]
MRFSRDRIKKLRQQGLDDWKELIDDVRGIVFWRTILSMSIGIPIFALGINGLIIQKELFSGGLTGVSLIIFYLSDGWRLGVIYFVLNIPLFLLGWRKISPKFILISLIGTIISSLSFELTKGISFPVEDKLITAIFAGVFAGFGNGLYFRFGGSAGGLDILGTYIRKRFSIPLGTTFNLFNLFVLLCAFAFNDLQTTLYSGIYIFCNAWMIDKVQSGFSQRNAVMIITNYHEAVASGIMKGLDRGVTFLNARGGYSKKETDIVYTIINMTETGRLKDIVYQLDPGALVIILNTSAVIGSHFLTWEEEGYRPIK